MASTLTLRCHSKDEAVERKVEVQELVIAGWTGRDADALERHIAELEALGVSRPPTTPCFYRVAAGLLTTAAAIQVAGENTSDEAEGVLFALEDGLWVGAGSDHTDRQVESRSVTLAKQACFKPVATDLWRFDELADHWDDLILRSYTLTGSKRELYQEGSLAAMRTPEDLIRRYAGSALPPETAMYGGTLAVHGPIRPGERFEFELEDPVLDRKIDHGYDIQVLPTID